MVTSSPFLPGKMGVETLVGLPDQLAVEASFANTRLISCHKQHGFALGIESERRSPFATRRAKA
jgi:hypothetical protein